MAKCSDCRTMILVAGSSTSFMCARSGHLVKPEQEACFHIERKTPLLVDALAAALRWLWDRRYMDGDESGVTPGYTIGLTPGECERVQAVLIRHQKEVGDA